MIKNTKGTRRANSTKMLSLSTRDVPLAKNPSTGTAQQPLFLVLKVVLHAVVVISEVLRLNTKSRCSRCCRHISTQYSLLTRIAKGHNITPSHTRVDVLRHRNPLAMKKNIRNVKSPMEECP